MSSVKQLASVRLNLTGARGPIGIDLDGSPADGQILIKVAGGSRKFAGASALPAGAVVNSLAGTSATTAPSVGATNAALSGKTNASDLASATGPSFVNVQQQQGSVSTRAGTRTLYARVKEDMRVTDFYQGVADANMPQARTTGFNNSFDDTPYWQAAIAAMSDLNETRLRVPRSFYRVGSDGIPLTIGIAAQIVGDGHIESGKFNGTAITGGASEQATGAWIKCQPANGSNGIVIQNGSARGFSMSGIGLTQDHPAPVSGWNPTNYDFAIRVQNTLGSVHLDLTLQGLNKGVYLLNCGRINIGSIVGQCFNTGLFLDQIYDPVEINRLLFKPYWSGDNSVVGYQQINAIALKLGRCDGGRIGTMFALGMRNGVLLDDYGSGKTSDLHFDWCQVEEVKYGLYVNSALSTLTFDSFKAQCQDYTNNSAPIGDSCGVYLTNNSGGGHFAMGDVKLERWSTNGIHNDGSSAVRCKTLRASAWTTGSGPMVASPVTPIECMSNPITDSGIPLVSAAGQIKAPTYSVFA